eukprot:5523971-Prymnesium_polylepis.2
MIEGRDPCKTLHAFAAAVRLTPGNEKIAALKLNPFRHVHGKQADIEGSPFKSLEAIRAKWKTASTGPS